MAERLSYEYFSKMDFDDIDNFLDTATEREAMLLGIFDFEPELYKEREESVLSDKPCKECNVKTIYLGPDTVELQNNVCCMCGTLNK